MKVKAPQAARFRACALALALAASGCGPQSPAPSAPAPPERPQPSPVPDRPPPLIVPPPARPGPAACDDPAFAAAAAVNADSLRRLAWAPFRRPESGWEIYAPLIGREIGSACDPASSGFAAALAAWQGREGLGGVGQFGEESFGRMKARWQEARPFVRLGRACPPPPDAGRLEAAQVSEGYAGKAVSLRPAALAAWRRMAQAARADQPAIRGDPRNLTIFSAFRAPDADAERCAREHNCDGIVRATCSPHRTGLAVDMFVGAAPGFGPDSSADLNRLYQSKTATYRWLVANARRFGFVNYPFEPWHWEWTGEAP